MREHESHDILGREPGGLGRLADLRLLGCLHQRSDRSWADSSGYQRRALLKLGRAPVRLIALSEVDPGDQGRIEQQLAADLIAGSLHPDLEMERPLDLMRSGVPR